MQSEFNSNANISWAFIWVVTCFSFRTDSHIMQKFTLPMVSTIYNIARHLFLLVKLKLNVLAGGCKQRAKYAVV